MSERRPPSFQFRLSDILLAMLWFSAYLTAYLINR